MPQDKKGPVPGNIVSSIFSKDPKKPQGVSPDMVSSIFSKPEKKIQIDNLADKGKSVSLSKGSQKKNLPIGLDIGTNSIKILRLAAEPKSTPEVEKIIIKEIPREAQDDLKQRERLLPDLLKSVIEENKLGGSCFSCLPHNLCKVSLITLPQMSAGEIDKALRWEIRQSIQSDISDLSLDYVLLERQRSILQSNQMGILAVTASKKESMQYLGLLNSAGLSAQALDTQALADFAALEYTKAVAEDKAILFLDFGAAQATMSIINNAELIFTRALNISGNLLTKAISEYCKLSWPEAENLKRSPALSLLAKNLSASGAPDKATEARNAILPLLENMVQDIERACKYFFLQVLRLKESPFDKLILSGGACSVNSLAEFLSSRLNIAAQINDPLSKFTISDSSYRDQPVSGAVSASLSVALGLALRGL